MANDTRGAGTGAAAPPAALRGRPGLGRPTLRAITRCGATSSGAWSPQLRDRAHESYLARPRRDRHRHRAHPPARRDEREALAASAGRRWRCAASSRRRSSPSCRAGACWPSPPTSAPTSTSSTRRPRTSSTRAPATRPSWPTPRYAEYLRRCGEVGWKAIASRGGRRGLPGGAQALRGEGGPGGHSRGAAARRRAPRGRVGQPPPRLGEHPRQPPLLVDRRVRPGRLRSTRPRLYGAGLLSSLGESVHCLTPAVRKEPLTVACADVDYDITEMQPRLFVTPDFDAALRRARGVLRRAWPSGSEGTTGSPRRSRSGTVNHLVLSSGVEVTGRVGSLVEGRPAGRRRPCGPRSSGWTGLRSCLARRAWPRGARSTAPALVALGGDGPLRPGRFRVELPTGLVARGVLGRRPGGPRPRGPGWEGGRSACPGMPAAPRPRGAVGGGWAGRSRRVGPLVRGARAPSRRVTGRRGPGPGRRRRSGGGGRASTPSAPLRESGRERPGPAERSRLRPAARHPGEWLLQPRSRSSSGPRERVAVALTRRVAGRAHRPGAVESRDRWPDSPGDDTLARRHGQRFRVPARPDLGAARRATGSRSPCRRRPTRSSGARRGCFERDAVPPASRSRRPLVGLGGRRRPGDR